MASLLPAQDHILRGDRFIQQQQYFEALEQYVQARISVTDKTTEIFRKIAEKMVHTAQAIAKIIEELDAQATRLSAESTPESKQNALKIRNEIWGLLKRIDTITQPAKIALKPNEQGQTLDELDMKYQACLRAIQEQAKAHLLSRRACLQRRELTLGDGGMG